ncbi:enoyl-CoA hydratase/isomerase family protein [Rhodococcus sp. NPDC059968]|uniref:enoyl-CoA hydratase/isomerase family protein n=1 Tax=Rhodococcus sp. NPDC059968 TaxID=3347017 RepID=UPI00366D0730
MEKTLVEDAAVQNEPSSNGHEHRHGRDAQSVKQQLLNLDRIDFDGVDIAVIRFNRPEQRNPIDKETIASLSELLDLLMAGEATPDAIVLTGNGSTFSAGGDLKGYQTLYRDPARFRRFMEDFEDVCRKLSTVSALTVAMVNGTCVAGGLEISLACDLITMSDGARIGDGHLQFAQLPGAGGSQRLVRAIGVQQAKKWLLTAELYDAATADKAGLIALIAQKEELESRTFELIAKSAKLTPLGRTRMKELVNIAQVTTLDEGLQQELNLVFDYATTSYDATEGLHAFAARRPPNYRGE